MTPPHGACAATAVRGRPFEFFDLVLDLDAGTGVRAAGVRSCSHHHARRRRASCGPSGSAGRASPWCRSWDRKSARCAVSLPRGPLTSGPNIANPCFAARAALAVTADLGLVLPDDAIAVGELLDDIGDGFRRIRGPGDRLGVDRDRARHELDVDRRAYTRSRRPDPAREHAERTRQDDQHDERHICGSSRPPGINRSAGGDANGARHSIFSQQEHQLQQARSGDRAATAARRARRAASARGRFGTVRPAPARSSASRARTHLRDCVTVIGRR